MNDSDVQAHVEALVAEEHRLLSLAEERGLSNDERTRLEAVNVQLDRYYDLLRQRRAKREFGEEPDSAKLRSADVVERYLQ